MYFEGQGRLLVATVVNGVPGVFRWAGDVSKLAANPKADNEEVQESHSGQRLTALRIAKGKTMDVAITFREWLAENLALAFYATSTVIAAGTVTGEALPPGLKAGDYVRLKYTQISALTLTGAAALVEDVDYRIDSADHGTIEILTDQADPVTADYSYQGGTNLAMFNATSEERWLRFEGLNTADGNKPVLVELYRVQLDPTSAGDLISDSIAELEVSGGALYDATKEDDDVLGPFGRIVQIADPAAAP